MARSTDTLVATTTGLVPIITVSVCTLWSIQIDAVPRCMPFIDGCMSISAACRTPPVLYLFRVIMLPFCLLLIAYWLINDRQLRQRLAARAWPPRLILALGILGALFLGVYATYLGTDGPVYTFMRRIGVYVFFAGTAIAQLWTTLLLRRHHSNRWLRSQTALVMLLLALGPLNLILKATLADPDAMENRIEWFFGLAIFVYPLLSARLWQQRLAPRTSDRP